MRVRVHRQPARLHQICMHAPRGLGRWCLRAVSLHLLRGGCFLTRSWTAVEMWRRSVGCRGRGSASLGLAWRVPRSSCLSVISQSAGALGSAVSAYTDLGGRYACARAWAACTAAPNLHAGSPRFGSMVLASRLLRRAARPPSARSGRPAQTTPAHRPGVVHLVGSCTGQGPFRRGLEPDAEPSLWCTAQVSDSTLVTEATQLSQNLSHITSEVAAALPRDRFFGHRCRRPSRPGNSYCERCFQHKVG